MSYKQFWRPKTNSTPIPTPIPVQQPQTLTMDQIRKNVSLTADEYREQYVDRLIDNLTEHDSGLLEYVASGGDVRLWVSRVFWSRNISIDVINEWLSLMIIESLESCQLNNS